MTKDLTTADEKRVHDIIWQGMTTKSVRELSEATGLTMAQTLEIRNGLLEAVDALTLDQRRMKLIIDLQELSETALRAFHTTTDSRSEAPLLSVVNGSIKTMLAEMRHMEKAGSQEVETLNTLRRREIVEIYSSAAKPFVDWLVDKYELPEPEVAAKFQGLLSEAAKEMDARNDA